MPRYYPAFLDLRGKLAVVVGGGEVAERRVDLLLSCGAIVKLISPSLTPALTRLFETNAIQVECRAFRSGDCDGAFLVLACTDDPDVNAVVAEQGEKAQALVNVADNPAICDFIVPSIVARGDLLVAISTGGASPALAKRLRREIERLAGPEYEELVSVLSDLRERVQAVIADPQRRQEIFERFLDSNVLDLIRKGDKPGIDTLIQRLLR
jgi:precorrin-2 dehydrogenase/sirohydrochlorin ferrochelatase